MRKSYFLLFLVALVLRLGFLALRWGALPDWNIDALGYHQLALNLLHERAFSMHTQSPFLPDSIRTPGYPLFLAAVYALPGTSPRTVLVIQAMLDALTAVLAADMARRLTGFRKAGLLAGLLYALLPLAWRYAAELYVESFLTFWLALSFWLALWIVQREAGHPWLRGAFLGAAAGMSLLIKPNVVLLPLLLALPLLAHRRGRPLLAAAAMMLLMLAPWVARNAVVFGQPTLSTAFMENLARVSGPATLARAQGEVIAPWTPRWEAYYFQIVDMAAREHPDLFAVSEAKLTPRQAAARQAALADAARAVIRAHPTAFLLSHLAGSAQAWWLPLEQRFWYGWATGENWEATFPDGLLHALRVRGPGQGTWPAAALFFLFLAWNFIRIVFALAGAAFLFPADGAYVLAAVLFILYVTFLPGPIAYDRFHLPAMPLLQVFMAAGLAALWSWGRRILGPGQAVGDPASSSASHAR